MTNTDELTARRMTWIRALESDDITQTQNTLCRIDYTDVNYGDDAAEDDVIGFCCIGVALRKGADVKFNRLAMDKQDDYALFRELYGINQRTNDYLTAMNDGNSVESSREDFKFVRLSSTDVAADARSFKFIARFLRKVWGLTGVE